MKVIWSQVILPTLIFGMLIFGGMGWLFMAEYKGQVKDAYTMLDTTQDELYAEIDKTHKLHERVKQLEYLEKLFNDAMKKD